MQYFYYKYISKTIFQVHWSTWTKISYLWLGGSSDAAFQCDRISSIDTQVLEESLELGRGMLHLLTTDLDLHLPGFHHTFHSHDFLLFHGL